MSGGIAEISLLSLSLAFVPVLVVLYILFRWEASARGALLAVVRMLLQLLLVGYFLGYVFQSNSILVITGVLTLMLLMAAWISLRTAVKPTRVLFFRALFSIVVGGGSVLVLVTQGVLDVKPWYAPSYVIPLAGMIFANSMTAISLVVERLEAEIARDTGYDEAKIIAFKAGMIPVVNSLLAVGLVSLPGMMTGQILSGIEPHIAARYQIMVMCMIFGSAGISTAMFLMRIPTLRH
ncbi:MAG: ABC transporter permease [Gammaproteobacteria bacterium]|nr:ABC transporter permease [Gammaproteobacteria bacterium]